MVAASSAAYADRLSELSRSGVLSVAWVDEGLELSTEEDDLVVYLQVRAQLGTRRTEWFTEPTPLTAMSTSVVDLTVPETAMLDAEAATQWLTTLHAQLFVLRGTEPRAVVELAPCFLAWTDGIAAAPTLLAQHEADEVAAGGVLGGVVIPELADLPFVVRRTHVSPPVPDPDVTGDFRGSFPELEHEAHPPDDPSLELTDEEVSL